MTKYQKTPLLATLVAFSIAGCGTQSFKDRDPKISDINLNDEGIHVQVPMPDPTAKRVFYRAEAASLWNPGTKGFFADQRATTVGDLLTVNIEINDEASFSNASNTSRKGSSTIEKPVLFGYEKKIDRVLLGLSESDVPTGDLAQLASNTSASGDGRIKRDESIKLKIAALVIQELPNGSLVIAGRQEVKVNHELRELRIAGIIRPQDIGTDNTIPYDKIAEARIVYGGRGQLSRTQRTNYGGTIADIILPY
ncbi:MAG: flagellar basal body L-ring protein FlgH [Rhodobacteraceae bacterium]|nr:flagellar basal body L-ring protein FlgH [Paracoccaceae bacterium]